MASLLYLSQVAQGHPFRPANLYPIRTEISHMTGVNVILWQDSDSRYKDKYFDLLKDYVIVVNFGWNKLEPVRGAYDQDYIGLMDRFVAKAKSRGIYVVLRMHRWTYPGAYQSQQPTYAWILGYPVWIKKNPDFWENADKCWDSYIAMWTMLADHYKFEPNVVGFELMSEPGNDIGPGIYDPEGADWQSWNCGTCRKVMGVLFDKDKLYERTINAIHSVTDKLVIIEGFRGDVLRYVKANYDELQAVAGRPNSTNFAVGQSFYEWYNLEGLDSNRAIAKSWGVPLMVTEFGVKSNSIASPDPADVAWVEHACQAFAAKNVSWFYWNFGPGKGDYNLVDETNDKVSPILSSILPEYVVHLNPITIIAIHYEQLIIGSTSVGALVLLWDYAKRKYRIYN